MKIEVLSGDSDLAEVEALAARIWGQHYPGIISWAQVHYMLERGYRPVVIAADIDAGVRWIVARDGDRACGFAAFRERAPGCARLDKLYVSARDRGRGLARVLLTHLTDWARQRDIEDLDLTVNKNNSSSVAVYQRLGFEIRERVVADIGHGFVMDDYVMGRPIEGLTSE